MIYLGSCGARTSKTPPARDWLRDPAVRIQSTGYRTEPADPGLWGEIKDRVKDIEGIADSGAKIAEDVARIAGAAGLLIAQ